MLVIAADIPVKIKLPASNAAEVTPAVKYRFLLIPVPNRSIRPLELARAPTPGLDRVPVPRDEILFLHRGTYAFLRRQLPHLRDTAPRWNRPEQIPHDLVGSVKRCRQTVAIATGFRSIDQSDNIWVGSEVRVGDRHAMSNRRQQ